MEIALTEGKFAEKDFSDCHGQRDIEAETALSNLGRPSSFRDVLLQV